MPASTRATTRATTARKLALAAAVAVTLGAGALTAATTASATEVPLSGYELTWGIKQSYRTYVTTYAAGTFTAADGATQAADNGAFTFTGGSGSYDSDAHTVDLGFRGSLHIVSQLHGFDLTLSDVKFDSGAAEITADVTRNGTTTDDVPLATVTVTREMTGMTTTLTQQAADVFGSAGYAGAAGDPLTVVQKTTESTSPSPSPSASTSASASASPSASVSPSTNTSASASPSPSASASASESGSEETPAEGDIADGTLTWGVKESFRTYVVGSVAQGRITASDGATQAAGNGVFTFADATGSYDTDAGTLSAAFEGAVDFKGHESNGTYGLDLTLGNLRATVDGGTGELTADVTSLGTTTKNVALADLKADSADLTPEDDVITLDDVTATLTEAGAKAFSGYYTAGTDLDPVDLAVALTDDAQLPSGDGDSTATPTATATDASGTASGGVTGSTTGGTGGTGGSLAATGSALPAAALGTAAAVTVAAGAGVVFAVRRRRTEA
ncbi:HtaA domain-containing protein [Streptomyces sp. NPDC002763]|uniref:HtaA domain-containing protein n=1 Tax=Streptomyces sp. NPDC002763 TaxID=3154427 RepID=UPI00332CF8B4